MNFVAKMTNVHICEKGEVRSMQLVVKASGN